MRHKLLPTKELHGLSSKFIALQWNKYMLFRYNTEKPTIKSLTLLTIVAEKDVCVSSRCITSSDDYMHDLKTVDVVLHGGFI